MNSIPGGDGFDQKRRDTNLRHCASKTALGDSLQEDSGIVSGREPTGSFEAHQKTANSIHQVSCTPVCFKEGGFLYVQFQIENSNQTTNIRFL